MIRRDLKVSIHMRITKTLFFKIVAISLFIFFLGSGVFLYALNSSLPNANQIRSLHVYTGLKVESSDGHVIGFLGRGLSRPVSLDKIPLNLVNAVLAVEDKRYFEHRGVDVKGLMRATVALLKSGKKKQGGSTITMQLARQFYLTRNKTYTRKIKEVLLAWKMNKLLSKRKILELYLNQMYFGHGAYGVVSAAQVYYGKSLNQLTLAESAMLAAHLQSPSFVNAITSPQMAQKRRNSILLKMKKIGKVTTVEYDQAVAAELTAGPHKDLSLSSVEAPYFLAMIRHNLLKTYGTGVLKKSYTIKTTLNSQMQDMARKKLILSMVQYSVRHGYLGPKEILKSDSKDQAIVWQKALRKIPRDPILVPGAVVSVQTMSATLMLSDGRLVTVPWKGLSWARRRLPLPPGEDINQHDYLTYRLGPSPKNASDVLAVGDVVWLMQQHKQWVLSQKPQIQGALVTINVRSGAIEALVGGYDFKGSQYNHAAQMKRQIGSTAKPFFYSAAFEKGYTLASLFNDDASEVKDVNGKVAWKPKNFNHKYAGEINLKTAIRRSSNVVSVQVLQAIGLHYAIDYLRKFGFDQVDSTHEWGLVLGALELSPVNLASGYAVFANGGYRITPHSIARVNDYFNHPIEYKQFPVVMGDSNKKSSTNTGGGAPRVIMRSNSFLVSHMLSYPIFYRSHNSSKSVAKSSMREVSAKSGTSNRFRDTWYVGYDRNFVTAIWLGFDHGQSVGQSGMSLVKPIWVKYMRSILTLYKGNVIEVPDDVVKVAINPKTGKRVAAGTVGSVQEYFQRKHLPPTA